MNKDKITAQDIIDALASVDGVTKRVAEDFFRVFILSIEEALLQNESVKIKGLGTFKLQWIEPRKSVNVQTGEDILLSGYYKVNFVPDNDLKLLVNKPFEHLETIVLDENTNVKKADVKNSPEPELSVLSEQAEEIKDLLSEIQSMSSSVEQPIEEELVEIEETIDIVVEEEVVEQMEEEKKSVEEPDKKLEAENRTLVVSKKNKWPWVAAISLIIIVVLFLLLFFYNWNVNQWVNTYLLKKDVVVVEQVAEADHKKESVLEQPVLEEVVDEQTEWQKIFDKRLDQVEYITTIKAPRGTHLAQFSEKYYGSPYFWVYIYEANKSSISDPNKIRPNMMIKIPKLDSRLIDVNDVRCIEKAKELERIYLK